MTKLNIDNKRLLIREDFNVPMEEGRITNDARLLAAIPTIEWACQKNACIMLMSHLGRPEEGKYDAMFSLEPVSQRLSELLNRPVRFEKNWLDGIEILPGEIVLCENVRFNPGEKKDDDSLAKKMASLCDIFVMDAFATAHRSQASTHGVAKFAPVAAAGPLLIKELEALSKALEHPAHPLVAIVGGSKASTKMAILEKLIENVDGLIVGGGIANTFLAAQGIGIGVSLCEHDVDLINMIKKIMLDNKNKIYLPEDVMVATEFSKDAKARVCSVHEIFPTEMILDVGPKTAGHYAELLKKAGTILWNGPVGVFEFPAFSKGTEALADAIAESSAFSLAGGGDTLNAIDQFQVENKISYISTGGGAFLEFVEGKSLPAVSMLEKRGAA